MPSHNPATLHDASPTLPNWPYPRWIAHRGAGQLAPENTLAALERGARYGYRMAECDVKLSADGVPFLLHDSTLERTTSGSGPAGAHDWAQLACLDGGSWHSTGFQGEPLPTLDAVAAFCQAAGLWLNIEIKPSPGTAAATGRAVAQAAAHLWANHPQQPLLTSFEPAALAEAGLAAPELPRGLLLESLGAGWLETACALGCVAVVCHHPLWGDASMAAARRAGLRTLAYTVNDEATARRLLALGIDGIITDRVDFFAPLG